MVESVFRNFEKKPKFKNSNFAKEKILKNVFCELESREPEIENEKFFKKRDFSRNDLVV